VGDNLFYAMSFKIPAIHFNERSLVKVLISDSPGRIAAAGLFCTQDGEIDASLFQQRCNCPAHFLVPVVKRAHTADPEEVFSLVAPGKGLEVQSLGPVAPAAEPDAVWIVIIFEILKGELYLMGELAFIKHQRAADLHELGNMLDKDRAGLLAGTAGGAAPYLVFREGISHNRKNLFYRLALLPIAFRRLSQELFCLVFQVVLQILDHLSG